MTSLHSRFTENPFDLYDLHLFGLVAGHRNFTRAAHAAGITQSAMTRQIQALERSLGMPLLERSTREVRVTEAGAFLLNESKRLLNDCETTCVRIREEFAGARRRIRIGVSRSLSLAHLPGLLHANLKRQPEVGCRITHGTGDDLLGALEEGSIDLAILTRRPRLPGRLITTHRFADQFCLIAPDLGTNAVARLTRRQFAPWAGRQSWITLDPASETGRLLGTWMRRQGVAVAPIMEVDSFDLVVNLVALGLGCAFVPSRTLALYQGRRRFCRIQLPFRFERDLVVVSRRQRHPARHVSQFVRNILFQH